MTKTFNKLTLILAPLLLTLVATGVAHSNDQGMSLDMDGLYREPSLIGTRPTGATWSPDSSRLAFAWNDQGGKSRDIWTWSLEAVTARPDGHFDVSASKRHFMSWDVRDQGKFVADKNGVVQHTLSPM